MKSLLTIAAILMAGVTAASAAKGPKVEGVTYLDGGKLPYEIFETSVDHVDLEECPDGLDNDEVFCRMTLASEQANIFVFLYEGDQYLVAIKTYPLDEGFLKLK